MQKIEFKNLPDTTTPLSAENLNQLQDNVEDAIPTLDSTVSTSSTNGVENQAITNYVDGIAATIPEVKTTQTTSDTATYSCTYINNNAGGLPSCTSLGTQTGTTPIALPNNFKELMVEIDTVPASSYQWYFVKEMLSSTTKNFRNGGFISSNANCSQVQVDVSTSSVSIGYVYYNGANEITSTSTITAWYR